MFFILSTPYCLMLVLYVRALMFDPFMFDDTLFFACFYTSRSAKLAQWIHDYVLGK